MRLIGFMCLLLLVEQGCRNVRREKIVEPPAIVSERRDRAEEVVMPGDSLHPVYKGLQAEVVDFYRSRNKRLAWNSATGLSPAGDSLVRFIAGIRYYGLLPTNYHAEEITEYLGHGIGNAIRLDALMTDAFLSIANDLMYGRLARNKNPKDSIAMGLLRRVAASGGVWECFNSAEPQQEGYQQLKSALKLVIDSLSLTQRLAVLQNSCEISDSLSTRIQAIEINLERWRAETTSWGSRYIIVNIPSFMLYVIADGAVVMESCVIVGKAETPTPELTSTVGHLVTYPYWHVPRKIAVEEYLPIIQSDTSFLRRNNFDVLDRAGLLVDPDSLPWGTFHRNYFPVLLRQREGTENSLGILKFVFDNPYAVFLHDTNGKSLFRKDVRAFSHGCIRMEKAVELSHYLMTGEAGKRAKMIDRYLKENLRHTVALPSPLPIYIRYFTAAVEGDSLVFYKDIYHKDGAAIKDLYGDYVQDTWRP
jgi:murein L,D-transpeptidase YcbB/YkuD